MDERSAHHYHRSTLLVSTALEQAHPREKNPKRSRSRKGLRSMGSQKSLNRSYRDPKNQLHERWTSTRTTMTTVQRR